jgi:hypothetical protein
VRPGSLRPSRWPARDWPAALDPWLPVRLGSLGAVVWLENEWRAAPDPSRSVAATPACSPRCALFPPPLRFSRQLKCSTECAYGGGGGTRPFRRRGSPAFGAWALPGNPRTPLGSLLDGAHTIEATASVAWSAPAGARRSTTRRRCGRPMDGRLCALRGVALV